MEPLTLTSGTSCPVRAERLGPGFGLTPIVVLVLATNVATQVQLCVVPSELEHKAGNAVHVIEAVQSIDKAATFVGSLDAGQRLSLGMEDVSPGTYLAISLRRAVGSQDAEATAMDLSVEVTPGLGFDALTVDSRASLHTGDRVLAFDGTISFPRVAAMPTPEIAMLFPYSPLDYAIPFETPIHLWRGCWWSIDATSANRPLRIDAHDHRTRDFPGPEPLVGPSMRAGGLDCGWLFTTTSPRIAADYFNNELTLRAGVWLPTAADLGPPPVSVLVVGSRLSKPVDLGGCALRVDPRAGAVLPMTATWPSDVRETDLRVPWRPDLERSLLWAQSVATDGAEVWTSSMWAMTPPPWTPNGFDVTSSIADTARDPGHQAFPVTVLWRCAS